MMSNQLEVIPATLPVLALAVPTDQQYVQLRPTLEQQGRLIGPNDLLIAAPAHAIDAILVTDNTRELERVQVRIIENSLQSG